jgi:polyisoprenoid-binding protein YceI
MKTILIILTVTFLTVLTVSAQNSVKYGADKSKSYITYSMSHPMHDWDGTSKNMNSVLIYNSDTKLIEKVATAIPVSTFDSQNSNRDSHMIEVVEAIKFPTVTFSSTAITGTLDKMSVTGTLTFHGVAKTVIFDASAKVNGNEIEVNGAFNVTMTDFKVEVPSLMGIPTKDLIQLKFYGVYKLK